MKQDILILPAHIIEQTKWDDCIIANANGLIYAQYDYLDNTCDNWHGLVIGDYEAVMALPWRKKYGFRYYYTPPFIQQLGLIGNVTSVDVETLTRKIRQFAWYGDLNLNFNNQSLAKVMKAKPKTNFIIDLKQGYDLVYHAYSNDLKQILRKGHDSFLYNNDYPFTEVIADYQTLYAHRMPHISEEEFSRLGILARLYSSKNVCTTRSITNASGTILSQSLLMFDDKRIYHLLNTTTAEGRALHSNHHLLDRVIKEFSGKELIFDFEGSELDGVKTFYKKFGGEIQPYFQYHRNALKGV